MFSDTDNILNLYRASFNFVLTVWALGNSYGGNDGVFIDAGMLSGETVTIWRSHNFHP